MVMKLSSLRVTADFDASDYVAGMNAKVQADKAGSQSGRQVGTTVKETQQTFKTSANAVERLSRQYVDGYASAQRFDAALKTLGRAMETGAIPMQRAEAALEGIYRKFGLTANASDLAERGFVSLSRSVTGLNARLETHETALQAATVAQQRFTRSTRNAAFQQRMLMFQLNDIGVSLASGMNPMMVLVQQGAQIQQVYAGQGGVNHAFRDLRSMIGRVVTRFPALTAAAAAGAVGIAGLRYEINRTRQEAASFGEVTIAVLQVLRDRIYTVLKPAIEVIGPWFGEAWKAIASSTQMAGNLIINSFHAAAYDVQALWNTLPDMLGWAIYETARNVVSGVQAMIDQVIKVFKGLQNMLPEQFQFFRNLGDIKLTPPDNPYSKTLQEALAQRNAEIERIMAQDPFGEFYKDVLEGLTIGGGAGGSGGAMGQMAASYDRLTRSARDFIAQKKLEAQTVGLSVREAARLRHEQDLLNRAANENIRLTPVQAMELRAYADEMALAEARTGSLRAAHDRAKETTRGFFSDLSAGLRNGGDAWETFGNAATNALGRVTDYMINNFVDALFQVDSAMSGLGGGGFWASLFGGSSAGGSNIPIPTPRPAGFAAGGYTGFGDPRGVAGVVHRREYVFDAASTERIGVGTLDAMRYSALRGLTHGGLVGGPAMPRAPAANGNAGEVRIVLVDGKGRDIPAKRSQTANGVQIEVELDKVVAGLIPNSGSRTHKALQGTFGVRRQIGRR